MKDPYLLSQHKVKNKDDMFLYINIHTVVTCNLNILYFQKNICTYNTAWLEKNMSSVHNHFPFLEQSSFL